MFAQHALYGAVAVRVGFLWLIVCHHVLARKAGIVVLATCMQHFVSLLM